MSVFFSKPEENQQIEASSLFSISYISVIFFSFFVTVGLLPVMLQDY